MENLLERIIQEEKSEESARLNAINIVSQLFSDLMDREKDIIFRRFGLKGGKGDTLEKIGQLHKLTRERVRQIEAASIKKIKKLESLEDHIGALRHTVKRLVDNHGGLIRQEYLLDLLTVISLELDTDRDPENVDTDRSAYKNHFHFLLSRILQDDLEIVGDKEAFNPSYKLKDSDLTHLEELANDLIAKVDALKKTLSTDELLEMLKQLEAYNKHQEKLIGGRDLDMTRVLKSQIFPDKAEIINSNKVLYSLMQAVRNLERNKYGHWGLSDWKEIKPKTINDKIYLVLKNQAEPMHFTAIADKINEVAFDHKKANAATVHNELILDNRYVLVGRGVYGLREWNK